MVILKDERSSHKYYIINNGAIMEIQNGTVKNANTGVKTRLSFFYQHEGEAVHLKFNEVVSEMQKSSKYDNLNISVDVASSSDGLIRENVGSRFIEEVKAFKSMMLERAGFLMDMGRLLQDKLHQLDPTGLHNAKSILNKSHKSLSSSYDFGLIKPVRNYNLGEQKLKRIEEKERRAMADSPSKVKYKSLMDREIVIDDERLELISKFAQNHTDFIKYKGQTKVSPNTFDNNLEYCNMFLYKITPMVVIEMKDLVGLMEEINGQRACTNEKRVFAANLGLIDVKLKEYMDYSPRQSRRLEYKQKRTLYTNGSFRDQRVSTSEESEIVTDKKKEQRPVSALLSSSTVSTTSSDSGKEEVKNKSKPKSASFGSGIYSTTSSDSSKEGAVKNRQKRCGNCVGCKRPDNCGKCAPCSNPKSHSICMMRRCDELMKNKKNGIRPKSASFRSGIVSTASSDSSKEGVVKNRQKRCGKCIGCKRPDNCGKCGPCSNPKSHAICMLRRCDELMRIKKQAKVVQDDNLRYSFSKSHSNTSKKSNKAKDDDNSRYSFNGNHSKNSKGKVKRLRCGYCLPCKRQNCGQCNPCLKKSSHKVCKRRRCIMLQHRRTPTSDESSTEHSINSLSSHSTHAQNKETNNKVIQRKAAESEQKWKKLKRFLNQTSSDSSNDQPTPKKRLLNTPRKSSLLLLNSSSDHDRRTSEKSFKNGSRISEILNASQSKEPELKKSPGRVAKPKRLLPGYKEASYTLPSSSGSEFETSRKSKNPIRNSSQLKHSTPIQEERSLRKRPMISISHHSLSSTSLSSDQNEIDAADIRPGIKKNFKILDEFGTDSLDKIEKAKDDTQQSSLKSVSEINNYPSRKSGTFYKISEDQKIIKFVLKRNNAKRVSGNVIWKELESKEFTENDKPVRTWQSLRNRFLKYILLNLREYSLSHEEEQKIRLAACTGYIKRKQPKMVKKNMPGFSASDKTLPKGK